MVQPLSVNNEGDNVHLTVNNDDDDTKKCTRQDLIGFDVSTVSQKDGRGIKNVK